MSATSPASMPLREVSTRGVRPTRSAPWRLRLSEHLCSSSVVLLTCLPSAFAGTVEVQTSDTEPDRQWQINGSSVTINETLSTTDTMAARIPMIDIGSTADTYWLFFTNSTSTQGNISGEIDQGNDGFDQPLEITQSQGLYLFDGVDNSENYSEPGGPNIQGSILVDSVPFNFNTGTYNSNGEGPTAAFGFRSRGIQGPSREPGASAGGDVSLTVSGNLQAIGTLAPGSGSLPWRAGGALVSVRSVGANAGTGQSCDDFTGFCAPAPFIGGDGGKVTLSTADGSDLLLTFQNQAITAYDTAPFAALMAVSLGGSGGSYEGSGESGSNGKGSAVSVTTGKHQIIGSTAYLMGVVAASVGGASQPQSDDKSDLAPSGASGDVDVTLNGTQISLTGNNAIGVVATSTGDLVVPAHNSSFSGSANTFGDVTVTANVGSDITVGNQHGTSQAATDTNIGILALSAPSWATQPFSGADSGGRPSPGTPGNVAVTLNQAKVTSYGDGAIGVQAQSIAGDGASASGGARAFVGDSGAAGGTAGTVTFQNHGGTLTTTGDGATGALLQSIAGGGGNGGNAVGLFVAVGGDGGDGGNGNTVSFSQSHSATIQTTGDYAQGVVLQSVGGGGGSGGYAKSYSIGIPAAVGVGGRGGVGGSGGNLLLGGVNDTNTDTSSSILTAGQHAHGLIGHTIGSGGGTGGAATSVDANVFTVSVAVGGDSGTGGAGGDIGGIGGGNATSVGSITTTGHDAHGVVLQSIGGGGGVAGGSTAAAVSAFTPPYVPTFNTAISIGGTAGAGGAGGSINYSQLSPIRTQGTAAHGLTLQSIGGGGGLGGDATAGAGAFVQAASFTLNSSVGIGGSGGQGVYGGNINLTASAPIVTQGHHAVGISAQSIAGGGGVGGIGNAAAMIGASLEEASTQIEIGVGGSSGAGGAGGAVEITTTSGGSITTLGSGAIGILAQSIGSGGGVAGNAGAQAVGGKFSQAVTVGGNGGAGGWSGQVTVDFSGQISTGDKYQIRYQDKSGNSQLTTPVATGGGAHGIVAQSIAGSGGIGGNADPSAAIVPDLFAAIVDDVDKLFDVKGALLWWAKKIVDYDTEEYEFPLSIKSKVAVGGSGGMGGDAGDVKVSLNHGSSIATVGHRTHAVLAQSIGGGGGVGGSASGDSLLDTDIGLSPLTGADFDFQVNVGGAAGSGGSGGNVSLISNNPHSSSLNNRLVSSGYGSHLLVLQSIGGGGGIGHEGSIFGLSGKVSGITTPTLTLGSFEATSGTGSSGQGGSIDVGSSTTPFTGLFDTAGDDAAVLLAQSIGGGGGLISVACTNSGRPQGSAVASACYTNAGTADSSVQAATYIPSPFVNTTQAYDFTIKGGGDGSGGDITLTLGDAGMHTTGNRAHSIVAQSLGGGGGYAAADMRNVAAATIQSLQPDYASNRSGNLDIHLQDTELTTAGNGAWGILAQSIASGGGLLGDTSADLTAVPTLASYSALPDDYAQAGSITISLTDKASIRTGDSTHGNYPVNTHGIVAQSVGGGGGIVAGGQQSDKATLDLMVNTGSGNAGGYGGGITINLDAGTSIDAQGIGAIGILAQSGGSYENPQGDGIAITINGSVTGGRTGVNPQSGRSLDGVGVLLSGGGRSFANTITIGEGGLLTTQGGASSGYAIQNVDSLVQVSNAGTVTGSVELRYGASTFTNTATGTLNKGDVFVVGTGSLENYGTVNVGHFDTVAESRLVGNFNQYDSGRLILTADRLDADQGHDRLSIQGVSNLAGTLQVHGRSILPGEIAVIEAETLNFQGVVAHPLLYRWRHAQVGQTLTLRPEADFLPVGIPLDATSRSLAQYLTRGWLASDAGKAQLFGYLNQVQHREQYQQALRQLSGQNLLAQPQEMVQRAYDVFGDSLECPAGLQTAVRQATQGCTWARISGTRSDLSGTSSTLGYRSEGGGLRAGMQREINADWQVGATVGVQQNRLSADGFSSKGELLDASASVTRRQGALSVTGAVAVAHGRFDNERTPQLGAAGQPLLRTYDSRSRTTMAGIRVRTAYEFQAQESYVKPYLDVDVVHTHTPGFEESGGPLALAVGRSSKTQAIISPMIEVGTRRELSNGTAVRGYASAGASILPSNSRSSNVRLAQAQAGVGSFNLTRQGPSAVGRVNVGVEVQARNNLSFSAEYSAQAGSQYRSQSVGARLNYRF